MDKLKEQYTKEDYLKAKEYLQMANDYPNSKYNDSRGIDIAISMFEQLIKEHFDLVKKIEWLKEEMTEPAFNLVFSTQEFLHNWYKGIQMYSAENDVLKRKVSEYENPQPYKFEDLKVGMWVCDDKEKKCNKIIEIEGRNIDFYYITESIDRFIVEFEEGRFYPITKALYERFKGSER